MYIIGDGHQPNSRGLYYTPIIRIPIKGVMTIPNIATFDPGTYDWIFKRSQLLLLMVAFQKNQNNYDLVIYTPDAPWDLYKYSVGYCNWCC